MKTIKRIATLLLSTLLIFSLCACETPAVPDDTKGNITNSTRETITLPTVTEPTTAPTESMPANPDSNALPQLNHAMFNGTDAYMIVNGGKPFFTKNEITTKSFERYAQLDKLGRCGVTMACVGKDLMPTDGRESISSVYPSGWKTDGKSNNHQYDFVDGTYVYNRCHLIGFQLTGENANKQNLITGTRYLNINGMLAFENMVADAVREDNLHVMYRVTPVYENDNLLPEGVLMEGYSVEDKGETIEFCVFAFNVQPGVDFNYKTGENWLATDDPSVPDNTTSNPTESDLNTYILNTNSKKFHNQDCSSAAKISDKNRDERTCSREELIDDGYTPCGACNP